MKVSVDIYEEDVEGDYGYGPGLKMICARCGHGVEVMGTGSASARRGAYMLREECPNAESNFYDVDVWEG